MCSCQSGKHHHSTARKAPLSLNPDRPLAYGSWSIHYRYDIIEVTHLYRYIGRITSLLKKVQTKKGKLS